jgi:hypothetical protein
VTEEERDSLVCSPVHDPNGNLSEAVAGSKVVHCDRCGREVWIAPSGRRMVDEKGLELVCIPCTVVAVRNDPDVKFGVHSASLVELRDHYRDR